MPGHMRAAVLDRRSDASCPQDNGTVWSANGYSWDILCNYDFPGNDLPAQPATSLTQCIDACNNYKQDEQYLNGANCIAVVYGAANINGNPCYLKAKIDTVTSGNYMQYVARRTQYNVGESPIYTSIQPSASSTSPPIQASTSHPSVLSSVSIIDVSTASVKTQPLPSTQNTVSSAGTINTLAIDSGTAGQATLSSGSPRPTTISFQVLISTLTQNGATQTITTSALPLNSAASDNTNTNMPPASASASSSTTTPLSATSTPTTSSSTTGLSDGAKIGIGVGLGVAVAIILSLLLYIFFTRRRRHKEAQTIPQSPAASKPTLFSHTLGQHPSTLKEKDYLVSEVPEMSSPQPAAAELESEKKYHELAGGEHPGVAELHTNKASTGYVWNRNTDMGSPRSEM